MQRLSTPTHLSEAAKAWLDDIRPLRKWTESEWKLVRLAAEAYDRTQVARRTLGREGIVIRFPLFNKQGEEVGERIMPHPATAIARDNTALVSKLFAQLGLDKPRVSTEPIEPEKPKGLVEQLQNMAGDS